MAVQINGSIDPRRRFYVFFSFQPLDSLAGLVSWQVLGLVFCTSRDRLPDGAYSVLIYCPSLHFFFFFFFGLR